MPDAMNFRHQVTMATRPTQNNNKGSIQPNRKKNIKNAIQMKISYKHDSNRELYELSHINVTYVKEKETPTWKKHSTVYATGNQSKTSYIQQI